LDVCPMQSVLIDNEIPDTMPEKPIDIIMLQRIGDEQKGILERLGKIEDRLFGFGVSVGRVEAATEAPREVPWWIRFILAPLVVTASIATVTAVTVDYVKVARIETYLHDNGGFIAGLRLQQNAANPSDPQSVRDAKLVLAEAERAKITIPPSTVKRAGDKFLEVSKNDPQAWNTTLSFLDYRSLLNVTAVPKLTDGKLDKTFPQRFGSHLRTPRTGNADDIAKGQQAVEAQQALFFGSLVTENFAVMERMEGPFNATEGYQFIVYQIPNHPEAELVLDGLHMRNVIVKNMRIAYYGGAVRLENVYFANCTFTFESPATPQTLDLASAILASPAITFIRNT